jgi:AraC-like DNA-binding protein
LKIFEEEKKYLLQDFDLTMLAKESNIPAHHLSHFFNHFFSSSFASYRNDLRMEHATTLIKTGFINNNTIEALAWTCGFSSRSSFSKIFKSYTGMNITEYINKTAPITK